MSWLEYEMGNQTRFGIQYERICRICFYVAGGKLYLCLIQLADFELIRQNPEQYIQTCDHELKSPITDAALRLTLSSRYQCTMKSISVILRNTAYLQSLI